MKRLGLLGGLSWESTATYYRVINEVVAARLGELHSAELVLYSVDFDPYARWQREDDWDRIGAGLADAARRLARAGAEHLLLCCNTMYKVAPAIEAAVDLPLLHIADATGAAATAAGCKRPGLLGTRFTLEDDFITGPLAARHGLECQVPDDAGRETVHRIIYDELCLGEIREASRTALRGLVSDLVARGADGVVLGCTELGLLLQPDDAPVPLFDTARIHAEAAADVVTSISTGAKAPTPRK